MDGEHRFKVSCTVDVSDEDVWDYLEMNGADIDELQESGYTLTEEDYRNCAHDKFEDQDFSYGTFDLIF